jgi:hypothetical protein
MVDDDDDVYYADQVFVEYPFDPRDYTGLKSEQDYKKFTKTSIQLFMKCKTNLQKYPHLLQEAEAKQRRLLQQLEKTEDVKSNNIHITVHFSPCPNEPLQYVVFSLSRQRITNVNSFLKLSVISFSDYCIKYGIKQTFENIQVGFRCKATDFHKFLIWIIMRSAHLWQNIIFKNMDNSSLAISRQLTAHLSWYVFNHPCVKLHEDLKILRDFGSYNLPLPESREHSLKEDAHKRLLLKKSQVMHAFLMGTHKRLGENSPVQTLCDDIIWKISKYVY